MNCFLGKERDFCSSQRARGTGVWARLVVAHRRGWHGHSRRDVHGLPARYRAAPRGPAAAQSSCPGVINHTDTKDRRKITLLDTELCTWVEGFSFLKLQERSQWGYPGTNEKAEGVSQYKRPGQWHMIQHILGFTLKYSASLSPVGSRLHWFNLFL